MTSTAPIEIVLNLLEYRERLKSPTDYLRFWDQLTAGLQGNPLIVGKTHVLESPKQGKIGLTIVSVPTDFSVVTTDTDFAIHSVLEPPYLRYKCFVCSSYGPFRCIVPNCGNRLCDEHVRILDGNMRAYCPKHEPMCKGSGTKASFWCDGPRCRGRVSWSDTYRVRHPYDLDHWYCPDCYALRFPPCSTGACKDTGTARCEHITEVTGKSCNRNLCNRHVRRWQIYGPHKLGVALCPEHANIKRYAEPEILFQMIAVTTRRASHRKYRRRDKGRAHISLPSLMSIRHIYINARNQVINPDDIDRRIENLAYELQNSKDRLAQEMADLVQRSKRKRKRELESFVSDQSEGQVIFEKLQERLRLQSEDVLVANLRFADFRPRNRLLFVYLDSQYRGRLIGKRGSKIKPLQEYLGVIIRFEEK